MKKQNKKVELVSFETSNVAINELVNLKNEFTTISEKGKLMIMLKQSGQIFQRFVSYDVNKLSFFDAVDICINDAVSYFFKDCGTIASYIEKTMPLTLSIVHEINDKQVHLKDVAKLKFSTLKALQVTDDKGKVTDYNNVYLQLQIVKTIAGALKIDEYRTTFVNNNAEKINEIQSILISHKEISKRTKAIEKIKKEASEYNDYKLIESVIPNFIQLAPIEQETKLKSKIAKLNNEILKHDTNSDKATEIYNNIQLCERVLKVVKR